MLFKEEVENMDELVTKLSSINKEFGKIKVSVVCFIFDENNNLTLNRRGPGARDEIGKLQAIGGSVNKHDISFKDAVKREIEEEAGSNASVQIEKFIGAMDDTKIDRETNELVNWVILAYKGIKVSGELINMEPDRCIGFETRKPEEFKEEELSSTAYHFIQELINE